MARCRGDSLATWALPALARVAEKMGVLFDIRREDQDVSTGPLRQGAVMGAITSVSTPVPGCSVHRLGVMRYRPVASRRFIDRWFPEGVTNAALMEAPLAGTEVVGLGVEETMALALPVVEAESSLELEPLVEEGLAEVVMEAEPVAVAEPEAEAVLVAEAEAEAEEEESDSTSPPSVLTMMSV